MYKTQWTIFGVKYILLQMFETIIVIAFGIIRVVSAKLGVKRIEQNDYG